jgi:hypothetical protein
LGTGRDLPPESMDPGLSFADLRYDLPVSEGVPLKNISIAGTSWKISKTRTKSVYAKQNLIKPTISILDLFIDRD